MIDKLIDKQDSFEIVRDQIAAILVTESANQQVLAAAASQDPSLWALKVYTERATAFEAARLGEDLTPIINIWYESSSTDLSASNNFQRQATNGVFNIDIYGFGNGSETPTGQLVADEEAAFSMQRALRLVRNMLKANIYVRLGLDGLVWDQTPNSTTTFQVETDATQVTRCVACRMALGVKFNEFSPQQDPSELDYVAISISRAEDGQIIAEADYDYQ
jgi:hypothetical protein